MDHFHSIHSCRAADDHPLIAAEDVEGNLQAALHEAAHFHGRRILDLDTGTGRCSSLTKFSK